MSRSHVERWLTSCDALKSPSDSVVIAFHGSVSVCASSLDKYSYAGALSSMIAKKLKGTISKTSPMATKPMQHAATGAPKKGSGHDKSAGGFGTRRSG